VQDVNGKHHDIVVGHAGKLADAAVHAVTTNTTVTGFFREAIKDVRNMFMEVFFGKGERGGEPGTPLNPLYYDLVAARKSQPLDSGLALNSITESILADPGRYHQPPASGPEHPQQQDPGREM
jgi:hypothetical protein